MMVYVRQSVPSIVIAIVLPLVLSEPDYFSEDYDEDMNLTREKINEIYKKNKEHCVSNTIPTATKSINDCKLKLTQKVLRPCITKTHHSQTHGKLRYCHKRGMTVCCIEDFKCNGHKEVNEIIKDLAKDYLTNKELYLKKEVEKRGYTNCYPIKGLDASKCAKECENLLKTSPLRDYCNQKEGLLKCCVRREKVFCDECRYCCTLPFCSYKDERGEVIVEGEEAVKANQRRQRDNQALQKKALYELRATNTLYKGYDNRCLKPDWSKPAKAWDHYDPDDFYDATTKEELKQAKITEFDKNFFNFEDPKVLKKFTDPKNTEIWKKTYGFDYVYVKKNSEFKLQTPTIEACVEMEKTSKFAKECRKDKGFLKCCNTVLNLKVFEETRQYLYDHSLIRRSPRDDKLPRGVYASVVTYSCTTENLLTGEFETRYNTQEKNPLGGEYISRTKQRIGFRNMFCASMNLCLDTIAIYRTKLHNINTREEFCQEEKNNLKPFPNYNEKIKNEPEGLIESYESCIKRKSVVRTCPKKVLKAINNQALSETSNKIHEFKKNLEKKHKGGKKKKKRGGKKKKKRRRGKKRRRSSKKTSEEYSFEISL